MRRPLSRAHRRLPLGLIGIGLLVGVVAVAMLNRWAADRAETALCQAALPALEPQGRLSLMSVGHAGPVVTIAYQVELPGPMRRAGLLRCAVTEDAPLFADPELTAVEFDGQPLGDARLFMLKRFWLGDAEAVAAGAARFQ